MEFFDSHCHLDIEPLPDEIGAVVERAYKAKVTRMINVGSSLRGSKKSVEIAQKYPNIWASVGLHPHDAENIYDLKDIIDELRSLAQNDKVVAIGEIGLDYFNLEKDDLKKSQKELFVAQLNLAKELKLPLIFHIRDAWEDFFSIIENWESRNRGYPGGVIHCFTGDEKIATKLIELGFFVGFTGFVTFDQEKFMHIKNAAKAVPIEKMLIETDAPFLAPEPCRGKTNEPAYVSYIAEKIAELKGISVDEVAERTFKNTKKVFNIR